MVLRRAARFARPRVGNEGLAELPLVLTQMVGQQHGQDLLLIVIALVRYRYQGAYDGFSDLQPGRVVMRDHD